MIWYIEDAERFRSERDAIENLVLRSDWLSPGEWRVDSSVRIAWDGEISANGEAFPFTLLYPNHFPHSPAMVLPRNSDERWSAHQYGAGGELCLEYGPDNWHSNVTGADMIDSAFRLLQTEGTPSKVAPSRHKTSLGQEMRGERQRLLVTSELRKVTEGFGDGVLLSGKLLRIFREESTVCVVTSMTLPDHSEWTDETIPSDIKLETRERSFLLTRWPVQKKAPWSTSGKELLGLVGFESRDEDVTHLFILHGDAIIGYRLWDNDSLTKTFTLPAQETVARLDASHQLLAARKVGIVGCGSLGSKLAVSLARSGVGNFLLVDDDILFPDNLVRNELDWRDIGTHKCVALARKIRLVRPSANCEVRKHRLGGQEASGSIETLIASLAACDLIVDATADPRVFGYVSAAVAAGSKPMLWAQVFAGGYGGLIARHRPSLEPDPHSMSQQIEAWCAEKGIPAPVGIDYETRAIAPMIADDADVSAIAAHAARLAIDTLIARSPSLFPHSVYAIGMGAEWIFDQPFDTRPIIMAPPVVATPRAVDPATVMAETALVLELFRKFQRENSAAASDPSAT